MPVLTEEKIRAACSVPSANQHFAQRSSARSLQPNMSVAEILDEIRRIAQIPLTQATTLPPQAFTSHDFFDWEVSNIFRSDWMPLAHLSQIPQPGDFLNIDLLGEPLIVVHGKDAQVRVLSRICPHRAMDIMPENFGYDGHGPASPTSGQPSCGHSRLFICPYHAWTFELDGRLKGSPEMQEAEDFKRDDWALKSFATTVWNGFIFVNLDGMAPPLGDRLSSLGETLQPWIDSDLQLAIQLEWECPFNWKVLAENFMESYHHMGAHAKTLQPIMPARDTWTEQERPGYIRCHLPFKPAQADEMRRQEAEGMFPEGLPPITGLADDQRYEWNLFMGFPLLMMVTTQDRLIWYRMQPLGPDRMRLLTTTLVPRSTLESSDWPQLCVKETQTLNSFHMEDMEVCTAVQRGFYSSGYQRGRLSHLEMPVWLIHRFLAARSRSTWPAIDTEPAPSQR